MGAVTTAQRCKATKANGEPCGGFAGAGGFCLAHDPARAGQIAAARRAGGRARHGRVVGPVGAAGPVKLAAVGDVLALLERAVNDVLALENSVNRARAVGYLAGAWGALYESSELERRIAALEAANNDKAR